MVCSYPLQSAALLLLLLLCFCTVFSDAEYLSVPVFRHGGSGPFVARIFHGADHQATDLVVDLGGSVTGLDCSGSVTHRVVSCPSLECSKAGGSGTGSGSGSGGWVGERGELVEDVVAVGSQVVDSVSGVDRFLYLCMPRSALRRFATAGGVLGLGRTRMSLPHQFSMTHFLDRKFSLCLSHSGGQLLIGDALSGTEISKTLVYTPLVTPRKDSNSHEHIISVNSIKIQGEELPVKVNGRAKLSTIAPFTTLQTSVYRAFTERFITAAASSYNATKAEPVWPFKTCFVGGSILPEVDLVLQSKMVKWRIAGRNLMVKMEKGVSCLGILDGGFEMGYEIVMGRYQLEDNLLEFDMGRSMLGFRSNRGRTSCADLKLKLESRWTRQQPSS